MPVSRRDFLKLTGSAAGGLVIALYAPGCSGQRHETQHNAPWQPNLFVRIDPDNSVTLTVHRSEMGQGVRTSLAMILAEHLDADWRSVRVQQSLANTDIGSQRTSGSGSVAGSYDGLRQAGAYARQLLIASAATEWGTTPELLHTDRGAVVNGSTGKRKPYGELVGTARRLKPSGSTALKDPRQFRLIGTSLPRLEGPGIVRGSAVYGIDVRVPGMRYGAVARCPVPGGKARSFDASAAREVAGVRQVIPISTGIAVVGDNTWAVWQGRAVLNVIWDEGENQKWSAPTIGQALQAALQPVIDEAGVRPPRSIEATYESPYLAHAPMEPLSCVADVRPKTCEIWAGTQNPQDVQSYVEKAIHRPVVVHVTDIGGGFGRRLEVDFAVEAAEVSLATRVPVKVVWSREDDLRHDYYRPPSRHWLRASWNDQGRLMQWRHGIAGPGLHGVVYQVGTEVLQDGLDVPYQIPDASSDARLADIALPTGPWRAVMDAPNAFANECFLDEIATALHRDPVQLRLDLLAADDPLRGVLTIAAAKSGWDTPSPPGRARGVACHQRENTPVAMVAEVSARDGRPRVERVICAVDCGTVINPDMVVQQMEGGIVFALTALLHGDITFDRGRVSQGNFDDYPLLQLADMPKVEVHIVPSSTPPQGVGEMAVPPLAPAVANAWFSLTKARIRRLPFGS